MYDEHGQLMLDQHGKPRLFFDPNDLSINESHVQEYLDEESMLEEQRKEQEALAEHQRQQEYIN